MPTNKTNRSSNRSNNNGTMGRAQDMAGEWGETVKDRPLVSAAAAAGAVAAGVFLWSKRNQISGQISRLSDQITDWAGEMRSSDGNSRALMKTGGPNESDAIEASRATTGQSRKAGANMNPGGGTAQSAGR